MKIGMIGLVIVIFGNRGRQLRGCTVNHNDGDADECHGGVSCQPAVYSYRRLVVSPDVRPSYH